MEKVQELVKVRSDQAVFVRYGIETTCLDLNFRTYPQFFESSASSFLTQFRHIFSLFYIKYPRIYFIIVKKQTKKTMMFTVCNTFF